MKLTKYTHSCIVLEEQGKRLVIDPGGFSDTFGNIEDVVGVVVTHVHGDHFDAGNLAKILQANPDTKVFTVPEVAAQWQDEHAVAVKAGEQKQVGPFTLEFFGEKHAEIHSLKPLADNIAVMINDSVYYPGDSLTVPGRPVAILALQANAPWVKMGESIEYLRAVAPTSFFLRVHDDLLSANGKMVYDTWLNMAADAYGYAFKPLEPGDSVDI